MSPLANEGPVTAGEDLLLGRVVSILEQAPGKRLGKRYGSGFSPRNRRYFRQFYSVFVDPVPIWSLPGSKSDVAGWGMSPLSTCTSIRYEKLQYLAQMAADLDVLSTQIMKMLRAVHS